MNEGATAYGALVALLERGGAILPFALDERLELIVDERVLAQTELFFNGGRLDRSLGVSVADYVRVARPRVARIASGERAR